jgi:hypothetical protein
MAWHGIIKKNKWMRKMDVQLDLFDSNDEMSLLRKEIDLIDNRTRNVQRGLFARHGDLVKMVLKQQEEIDRLRELLIKQVK